MTYDDAKAVIQAAPGSEFTLSEYTGGVSDLAYLRQWVLDQVVETYGVDQSVFDQPTLLSTSILRDFVHRALWQIDQSVPSISVIAQQPGFLGYEDVAVAFRYPAQGLCGHVAWQLYEVFRSFGYDTTVITTIDGDIGPLDAPYGYEDSHVTTEVYVADLGKWIVQDSTFNFLYRDTTGNFLSWYEARALDYGSGQLLFDGSHNYQSYQFTGIYEQQISPDLQDFFKANYLQTTWSTWDPDGVESQLITNLFPDWHTAHVAGSNQGRTFADAGAAVTALHGGGDWLALAQALRSQGYYISGFALVEGQNVSHWLTVRLTSGAYLSVNLEDQTVLNGSYDQLVNDAAGGPAPVLRNLLNPGVDLSAFLNPPYLLAYDGTLMDGGIRENHNVIEGDAAANNLVGTSGADVLYGLSGDDTLNGGSANDVLVGGPGDDTLNGGLGADYLLGGGGADTASYANATAGLTVRLDTPSSNTGEAAGDSYSSIENLEGSQFADTLIGNANANRLRGGGGGDILSGGDGDDYLVGASGADTFIGGNGSDTVSYYYAGVGVTARLDTPALNTGEAAGDSYSGIENLDGSQFADTLMGDGNANRLRGWGGGDVLNGQDGNDYLIGASGADTFIGGNGSDTVSYYFAASGLTARLDTPALNTGEGTGDSYSSIENLDGSQFADLLVGDAGTNRLTGWGGNDELRGNGGGDVLDGGDGDDYLVGGAGADVFIGGNGSDTVTYYFAAAGVTARLDAPGSNTGDAAGDSYSSVENLDGSQFADTLIGDANANRLRGWGGGDVLNGQDGDDYLIGAAGADTFIGGNGSDTVTYYFAAAGVTAWLDTQALNTGEAAGDSYSSIENLEGSQFADTLIGNANANRLRGGGGGDILSGGDGDDYLVGASGADTFIGGNGSDTVSYYYAGVGVTARLDTPALNTGEAAGDSYSGIENLDGSQFADTLMGDGNANRLRGWGGGDVLNGQDGNDYLIGASGADTFIGGNGSDTVSYYFAASGLTARLDTPALNTGEGTGDSYSSIENLDGSQFADLLVGDAGTNRLTGWGGNDELRGNGGGDVLDGGDGDDYLVGGAGADVFIGGNGSDTVTYYFAAAGVTARLDAPGSNTGDAAGDSYSSVENLDGSQFADTLIGDANANRLRGWGGGDVLNGQDGDDYLIGAAGADTFIGGIGSDTVSYYYAAAGLTARLDASVLNTGEAAGDSYSGIENLEGSQFGDTLVGNANANRLTGGAGVDNLWGKGGGDVLDGGDGNDYLVGAAGADTFIGGTGIDIVSYFFAAAGLTVRLDYSSLNTGEAAGDSYNSIENLYGSQYGDILVGNSSANRLTGWAGNDELWGMGGGDVLDGGDGDDYLVGAAGADTFIGGNGSDTVSYYFAAGGVTARLDNPALNTGDAAGDSYSGVESLYGSQFADVLVGDGSANRLTGWAGNDELRGNGGGDVLDGGDGNDYLVGAAGADTFIGGNGNDTASYYYAAAGLTARLDAPVLNTGEAAADSYSSIENLYGSQYGDILVGNSSANRLTGWAGNDELWGKGGGDVLDGGDGDDYLVGAAGADTFIGGNGSDTASYYFAAAGVTARLDNPALNTGDAAGDSYSGVESLYGSQFADVLIGNATANRLSGWAGNDELRGNGGGDVLDGGDGDDTLAGATGADTFIGGNGSDTASYYFAAAGVTARLDYPGLNTADAAGDSYSSIENLYGSQFADVLVGDGNANRLTGWAGNDELWANGSGDVLDGGEGDDYLVGAAGADTFIGGNGSDTASYYFAAAGVTAQLDLTGLNAGWAAGDSYSGIENLYGSQFADVLVGNATANRLSGWAGNDELRGNGGGDVLDGGDGNDYLVGAAGADAFIGGNGSDTVSYSFAAAGVTARLDAPGANTGEAAGDTYISIESLSGSQFGDVLVGNSSANQLTGWGGNDELWGKGGGDVLDGGDGDDYLVGAAGADTFIGGNGSDTASYYFAAAGVTARLDYPSLNTGDAAGDSYSGVESLYGSQYADVLVGNGNANRLTGCAGNDELWGKGGGDVLDGGDGNDYLVGAAGADTFIGGNGSDTASYYFAAAGVTARLDYPSLNTGDAAGDSYSGVESLYGSQFADVLVGDGSANRLTGCAGNDELRGNGGGDVLDGGDGDDLLVGAAGADVFIGGSGSDTVSYHFAASGVAARLNAPGLNTGDAAGDSYSSIENLYGSEYADTLCGDANANTLTGGSGADTFQFNSTLGPGNIDRVTDFNVSDDRLALDDVIFKALSPGVLPASAFVTGTGALDAGDRIIYDSSSGALSYDADGLGGVAMVQFATLSDGLALTSDHFLVV